jgi:hypothetical protein
VLDLSGVEGGGTFPKKNAEQERPCLAVESDKDRAYKTGRLNAREAGRASEGFIVPMKACKKTRWRQTDCAVVRRAAENTRETNEIAPARWTHPLLFPACPLTWYSRFEIRKSLGDENASLNEILRIEVAPSNPRRSP